MTNQELFSQGSLSPLPEVDVVHNRAPSQTDDEYCMKKPFRILKS
jgi:hypothetical protein